MKIPEQNSAVRQEIFEYGLSDTSQIAGDDPVIVRDISAGVDEVLTDGISCGRSHGCTHVDVYKRQAVIQAPLIMMSQNRQEEKDRRLSLIHISFSSNFRKMLTLEQYRDPKLAQLHHDYLAGGPLEYMAAIFRKLADSDEDAMQLALEFYGPMYLLYSVYDGAEEKESVSSLLATHIDHFIAKVEAGYRKKERTT